MLRSHLGLLAIAVGLILFAGSSHALRPAVPPFQVRAG